MPCGATMSRSSESRIAAAVDAIIADPAETMGAISYTEWPGEYSRVLRHDAEVTLREQNLNVVTWNSSPPQRRRSGGSGTGSRSKLNLVSPAEARTRMAPPTTFLQHAHAIHNATRGLRPSSVGRRVHRDAARSRCEDVTTAQSTDELHECMERGVPVIGRPTAAHARFSHGRPRRGEKAARYWKQTRRADDRRLQEGRPVAQGST